MYNKTRRRGGPAQIASRLYGVNSMAGYALVAELADARGLGPRSRKGLEVQILSRAQKQKHPTEEGCFCLLYKAMCCQTAGTTKEAVFKTASVTVMVTPIAQVETLAVVYAPVPEFMVRLLF